MDVLGHHNVSQNDEAIATPRALKNFKEQIAKRRHFQQWPALITTEGEEVEIASAVNAMKSVGHPRKIRN